MIVLFWNLCGFQTVQQSKINRGDVAPDFKFMDLDSNQHLLSTVEKDFIIVDFWASWCKPCRLANAKLQRLYSDSLFKNKVEIVSVSLDTDSSVWRIAIRNDDMQWRNQLCDFKGKEGVITRQYHVKSLPQLFFMDKTLKLIAINPTTAFLKETILN